MAKEMEHRATLVALASRFSIPDHMDALVAWDHLRCSLCDLRFFSDVA
jgi:hypothetical protein